MTADVTGSNNTALGYTALAANTTASNNVAIGHNALVVNSTGASNTAVGVEALDANTTASNNTAVGRQALSANTTGNSNVAIGYQSLDANTTAGGNTAIGTYAGTANTTGDSNTFFGYEAGDKVTTGTSNVAMGHRSMGTLTTGSSNTVVGQGANTSASGASSQIVLGQGVTGNANSSFCFGTGSSDSAISNGATSITAPSDIRLKEDIQDEVVGLNFINELRPVTFLWKKAKDVPPEMKAYSDSEERVMNGKYNHGFVAQEVKEAIDNNPDIKEGFDMWSEDDADGRQRIGEAALMPIMVKAVQELSAEVEQLKSKTKE
jgi:hypothetical protein